MRPIIYLDSTKLHLFRQGHPWIYPKAIAKEKGLFNDGDLIDIADNVGIIIGTGVYNSHSLYRVRVLSRLSDGIDTASLETIVRHRLQQAIMLRSCLNLPNEETTAYRLCNSEADGLSGLTIDRFNHYYVVSSSAYWVEQNKALIIRCLQDFFPDAENSSARGIYSQQLSFQQGANEGGKGVYMQYMTEAERIGNTAENSSAKSIIVWLPQLKALAQDGFSVENQSSSSGSDEVMEGGVRYQVDFSATQKTGLFLDQRENHMRMAALAKGKRVLDLYTYTGGFALHAAKAGASLVTAVDSSDKAIVLAQRNAVLNGLDNIDFITADARDYLNKTGEYDIVILDPPKLVPSRKHLAQAKNYYRFLHREVFKYMRKGSLLMTCNCSSALSEHAFTELVSTQALLAGKDVRILGVFGPASCHPRLSAFPEGNYLTAILLAIV